MASNKLSKEELMSIFRESLLKVSKVVKKAPCDITRDEYVLCSRFLDHKDRLDKDNLTKISGYRNALNELFPRNKEEISTKQDVLAENAEYNAVVDNFIDYVKKNNYVPAMKELPVEAKRYFKDIKELLEVAYQKDIELIDFVFSEDDFTEDYYNNVVEQIKKYKRFVITTAVSNKKVHEGFFKCLKSYAKHNDALILALPCENVTNRWQASEWVLDPKLKEALVIFKDTRLNNNLFISDIKVSARQLLPTTGLSRLAQSNGSMILASPKQFLEYVPISNEKLPLAIMTTGAVTTDDYKGKDYYMSKRLSKIAENDHVLGAVIVEVENEDVFHFRQVQYENNMIVDLGLEYRDTGIIGRTTGAVCIFGDSHVSVKDDEVHKIVKDIVYYSNIEDIVLHDIFDGACVSHHVSSKPIVRATDYLNNQGSIEKEGKQVAEYLEDVGKWVDGKLVVVYSNHNTFLERYLEDGRYIKDYNNCYLAHYLAIALMEGKDPLKYLVEEKVGLSEDIEVKWLNVNEDYNVYGVELSNHGHLGANGSKGSAKNIERCYKKSILGHSHAPCIYRNVFQVGTLSKLRLGYNKGASSWVNNVGILYSNGSRQLINIIRCSDGTFSWKI